MATRFNPCILIPVYNHEGPLPAIVERLAPYKLPCILVDDGSRESCAGVVRSLSSQYHWVRSIRLEVNRGKGGAVKEGLLSALGQGYTHAVQIDADGQHDLDDLGKFLAVASETPQAVVIGQPIFDESIPKLRYYARYLTHVWVCINTASFSIRDSMCGYRVYPVDVCARLIETTALEDRMAFDVEILVRLYWQGVPVVSIPTRVGYPQDGVSHFRGWEDNLRISLTHARLFFGMLPRLPKLLAMHAMKPGDATRHWASLEETSFIWGIRALVWVYRIFGRWAFRLFLLPVVSYYFLTGRTARNASREYLRRLGRHFPELGLSGSGWESYRHFLSFGETLLDKIIAWTGNIDPSQVGFPNHQLLLDLLGQKRGAMILSGHVGNLEICQAIANLRGHIHLNILVHTKHAEKFNRLLGGSGGSETIRLIQVTELNPATAIDLQEKIERGEFLVLVGDRIPVQGSRTVSASFLGKDAEFPQGPYLLASLLRCPVYTLFCYPTGGRFQINLEFFAESIRVPRHEPQRRQMLEALARRYAERLEAHCHAAPFQWFNFYPYWNLSTDAESGGTGSEEEFQ
jgi:predicted LPLAT superfamily acyltransferase